ncbi:cysteine-rich receptor-like protein kinase 44 [Triticum urartu]|nr:cysteine-rich receptor-like protein kinase 44 [Triticum urartu]
MANKIQHTSATTREFTLELLKQITDDFSEEHVIGRGAYGVVYKGLLHDGEEIALKKLHYMPGLDDQQFMNEFNNLMRAQHPNIIRLVGYCYGLGHERFKYNGEYIFARVRERILCFEFLQGGSLENHISDESCGLDWNTRFKIIKGVSKGINYLHNGCKDSIYHLDLKPENILLDKNLVPKIGDFGLSRLFQTEKTHITNKFMGTIGYMPPEFIDRRAITPKFDVFSFGVIIIRIVAGYEGYSKCEHMSPHEFLEHVHGNWRKRMLETMSSHISEQVMTCIEIAFRCVEFDREKRPTIADIVNELNKIDKAESVAIAKNSDEQEHTLEKQPVIQVQEKNSTEENTRYTTTGSISRTSISERREYARTDSIYTVMKYQTANPVVAMASLILHKLRELLSTEYNLGAKLKKDREHLHRELENLCDAVDNIDSMMRSTSPELQGPRKDSYLVPLSPKRQSPRKDSYLLRLPRTSRKLSSQIKQPSRRNSCERKKGKGRN